MGAPSHVGAAPKAGGGEGAGGRRRRKKCILPRRAAASLLVALACAAASISTSLLWTSFEWGGASSESESAADAAAPLGADTLRRDPSASATRVDGALSGTRAATTTRSGSDGVVGAIAPPVGGGEGGGGPSASTASLSTSSAASAVGAGENPAGDAGGSGAVDDDSALSANAAAVESNPADGAGGGDDEKAKASPPSPVVAKEEEAGGLGRGPPPPPWRRRRFPPYGTESFDRLCGYMKRAGTGFPRCYLHATVDHYSNEGVSAWATNVAAMGLYAAESRCGVKVDYGPDVALTEILSPIDPSQLVDRSTAASSAAAGGDGSNTASMPKLLNWTVPQNFTCRGRCVKINEGGMRSAKKRPGVESRLTGRTRRLERPMVQVPLYRFAYNGGSDSIYKSKFENVTDLLPGFEIETGMACAWGRLFRLSPSAARYNPDLFTRILPAVRDEEAFVITLYMRTRNADRTANLITKGRAVTNDTTPIRDVYVRVCECASRLERKYLLPESAAGSADDDGGDGYGDGGQYVGARGAPARKIVWLVVTDSPNLSEFVARTYDTTSADYGGNLTTFLPRHVVTTSSKGVHTKPKNKPGTSSFADGFLDWYLIGESDVVISHGALSYGSTGALRTARPIYETGCHRLKLVREENEEEEEKKKETREKGNNVANVTAAAAPAGNISSVVGDGRSGDDSGGNQQSRSGVSVTNPAEDASGNISGKNDDVAALEIMGRTLSERRFPTYGTSEFDRRCGYTDRIGTGFANGCRFYATVDLWSNEGISAWASHVAALALYAAQSRCGIKVDYGPNVALTDILSPIVLPSTMDPEESEAAGEFAAASVNATTTGAVRVHRRVVNWTVPVGFNCYGRCAKVSEGYMSNPKKLAAAEYRLLRGKKLERSLVTVPYYRFAYNGGRYALRRRPFENVTDLLPGFVIESGMACAWNRLFRLSPSAAKYRPDLFERIWPAIHDEEAFVIALYIRTKNADRMARQKKNKMAVTADVTPFKEVHKKVCGCAIKLEEEYLTPRGVIGGGGAFTKIVWLVVTDSPNLSDYVAADYDTTSADYAGNFSAPLPRSVVTTSSVGAHSKPSNGPGTSEFADGFLDWYLIGESDLVISHGALSFGSTGALRTARPIYETGCNRLTLIKEN